MKIGQWEVPDKLFEEYVKWRIHADYYVSPESKVPTSGHPMISKYERAMRWKMCVKRLMELHKEICKAIGIPYSVEDDDEFYTLFHRLVKRRAEVK